MVVELSAVIRDKDYQLVRRCGGVTVRMAIVCISMAMFMATVVILVTRYLFMYMECLCMHMRACGNIVSEGRLSGHANDQSGCDPR